MPLSTSPRRESCRSSSAFVRATALASRCLPAPLFVGSQIPALDFFASDWADVWVARQQIAGLPDSGIAAALHRIFFLFRSSNGNTISTRRRRAHSPRAFTLDRMSCASLEASVWRPMWVWSLIFHHLLIRFFSAFGVLCPPLVVPTMGASWLHAQATHSQAPGSRRAPVSVPGQRILVISSRRYDDVSHRAHHTIPGAPPPSQRWKRNLSPRIPYSNPTRRLKRDGGTAPCEDLMRLIFDLLWC